MAFSGSIASGKTTVSKEASRVLGWKYGSFGDFIRKEAIRRGAKYESREVLQDIGSELINQGWDEFCWGVLRDAGWEKGHGLVLDGIRHLEGLEKIREIVNPLSVFLIFIQVSPNIRKKRLLEKKIKETNLLKFEQHQTEQQVKLKLLEYADLVVNGDQPLNIATKTIVDWLSTKMN